MEDPIEHPNSAPVSGPESSVDYSFQQVAQEFVDHDPLLGSWSAEKKDEEAKKIFDSLVKIDSKLKQSTGEAIYVNFQLPRPRMSTSTSVEGIAPTTSAIVAESQSGISDYFMIVAETDGIGLDIIKNPNTGSLQLMFGRNALISAETGYGGKNNNESTEIIQKGDRVIIPSGIDTRVLSSRRAQDFLVGDVDFTSITFFDSADNTGNLAFLFEFAGICSIDEFFHRYFIKHYEGKGVAYDELMRLELKARNNAQGHKTARGLSGSEPQEELMQNGPIQEPKLIEGSNNSQNDSTS
jgi:hypothetical protein